MWLRAHLFNTLHACLSVCFLHMQNCTQKLAVLNVNAYQNIPLAQYPISPYNLCQVKNDTVLCTFDQTFKSGRQRWWFVAVSKCDYCKVPPFIHLHFCLCLYLIVVTLWVFCSVFSQTVVCLYLRNVISNVHVSSAWLENLQRRAGEIGLWAYLQCFHLGDIKHYCSNFHGFSL